MRHQSVKLVHVVKVVFVTIGGLTTWVNWIQNFKVLLQELKPLNVNVWTWVALIDASINSGVVFAAAVVAIGWIFALRSLFKLRYLINVTQVGRLQFVDLVLHPLLLSTCGFPLDLKLKLSFWQSLLQVQDVLLAGLKVFSKLNFYFRQPFFLNLWLFQRA